MFPQIFPILFSLFILFPNVIVAEPQNAPIFSRAEKPIIRQIKQSDALRIEITEAGIYWLSYEDLAKVGLQPQFINPKRFRLFNQGEEVAIQVISEERDKFKPTDYMIFYAQSLDNTFTDTNVYWFYWRKKGFGKRMAFIDGAVTEPREKINAFYDNFHIEKNSFEDIWEGTPESQDYWFWQRLNISDVKEFTVDLPALPLAQTDALVRVGFRGRSNIPSVEPDHHTLIYFNDTLIGDERWDGDSAYIQEMSISSALIKERNTLRIELPGDTGAVVDTVYLNWIELDYWRHLEAVTESLPFTVNGNGKVQITVKKLSESDIVIYDITNPLQVIEIINFSVIEADGNYQAIFEDEIIGSKTYYIATLAQLKQSPNMTLWQPSKLKSLKNGADYILITAREFLPAVKPLTELRRSQGLRVKSVSVEDIYNEFNHGLFDPAAIKAFLKFAYDNWNRPAPIYIFLVGDASVDYRGYLKKGKKNKVPAHLYLAVGSKSLLIPDDNWYADVWSDYMGNYILPEMMIGRIPGDTPETVARLVEKIIRFEKSPQKGSPKALLVADSSQKEETLNDSLIDYLPSDFTVDKIYLRSYIKNVETDEQKKKKIAKANRDIISSINDGAMITNYAGHGAVDRWSKSKDLFKPENVHSLNNQDNLTFVLALTCINGLFTEPSKYALAEEFILADGGAIGVFSSSGLTYSEENGNLSREIFSILFEQENVTLGYLTTQAKFAAYNKGISTGVIRSFMLFGDPATTLKDWR